jgi:hypothetical protein
MGCSEVLPIKNYEVMDGVEPAEFMPNAFTNKYLLVQISWRRYEVGIELITPMPTPGSGSNEWVIVTTESAIIHTTADA